ncbi:restriction endonuclease subunit S [Comamonas flocculans]|uniref:Restriction endonuclease subunit S n=1 Tax=Comamonas flocculans TaxID=2597701 RepID=A0A5B8RVC1_9BURK|nr:restriction endonuclease subunit S [Comamonas flocculans]QEA13549.1 restriction endonuclease subunit S [Comamonas flocculans]
MSFPRYPEYKDSGVEWLGEVPAHWEVERIKRRCEVFPSNVDKKMHEGEKPVLLCNYTDVYYNDLIVAGLDFMAASATDEQIVRFTLQRGDTIITKDSETADDIGISAFVPDDLPGVVCGYHLTMIRPSVGIDGAFVKRLFDAHSTKAHLEVSANGLTRVGLGQYALDNLTFAWPPLNEQRNIATFLDRETAKIDALVAEQEKLIALLQEKRQAVIFHAVTKGLDPNVPMKDSGVEWLGEVPIHWEVSPFKWLLDRNDGGVWGDDPDGTDDTLVLRSTEQTVDGQWRLENAATRKLSATERAAALLESGDLVVTKSSGSSLHIGKTTLVTDEIAQLGCCYSNFMQRLRMKPSFSPLLAWYILNNDIARLQFDLLSNSTTGLANLNGTMIGQMMLAIPPGEEQTAIATFLDRETAKLDTLMTEARSAITLLQERRTALISAAVTGQIDVRGLAGGAIAPNSIAASAYPASDGG